ncbi:MAG: endonuclease domain-containing protein [Planctomycetaceae bacterium]|nr:endonuclease domain-containing protein [Planctomycetaceae bacterium]
MTDAYFYNRPDLKPFRRQLRTDLTPAEAKLWSFLKNKQLDGRRFRRQHSLGDYIIDFYCPSERLAIELDGQVHLDGASPEYDRRRDLFLEGRDIKTVRFINAWVFNNPEGVLNLIREQFGWYEREEKPCAICFYTPSPLCGTGPCQGES